MLYRTLLKIFRFALVSGMGLALDVCIFLVLVHFGVVPLIANLFSAATSTTFVYFVSISTIFSYRGKFALPLFVIYCLYQFIAIVTTSYFVSLLAKYFGQPLLAKIIVLPFTFSANFLFMTLLTRQRSLYLERT